MALVHLIAKSEFIRRYLSQLSALSRPTASSPVYPHIHYTVSTRVSAKRRDFYARTGKNSWKKQRLSRRKRARLDYHSRIASSLPLDSIERLHDSKMVALRVDTLRGALCGIVILGWVRIKNRSVISTPGSFVSFQGTRDRPEHRTRKPRL